MNTVDTIIVVPNHKKKKILLKHSQQQKITQEKYMTLEELLENITLHPKKESIYYLMKELHLSYFLASTYLENIPHITNIKESKHENVKKLLEIKQFLEDNHLLEDNQMFMKYIKGKHIRIDGYSLTKEQKKILKQLEPSTTVTIIEKESLSYCHPLYVFETIEEEIAFVASDIANRLQNGLSIEHIYLANVTIEYLIPLHRIFHMYGIPLEEKSTHPLYGNPMVQHWLQQLTTENAYEMLEKMGNHLSTEEEHQIYLKLLQIYNDYVMLPKDDLWKICIEEAIKEATIPRSCQHHAVQIQNIKESDFQANEYVYILGMNQENIPTIKQDEDYLNDAICKELKIDTTFDKNELEKTTMIRKINAIPNAILSYKKKTNYGIYYPSSLLPHLATEKKIAATSYQYSDIWNQMELSHLLDCYTQYNEVHKDLKLLYGHYQNLPYCTYDNQYQPISKQKLKESLNGKLVLSYTSLDRFYRCQFRYYISHILKLDAYKETFAQAIGNLFHYFLSIAFQDSFHFETEWKQYHEGKNYTAKESFFLEKLKQELLFVIATIQEQNTYTQLNQEAYEQKIFKSISGDLKITFMGIIDKIKYKEEDGTIYAAIIDYKTGTLETNLNQSIYGIEMQLPIYLYLIKNKAEWKNVKVIGFYLQKMIPNEMTNDENNDYNAMKKDAMRLEGYSIDDFQLLNQLDETYQDSRMIKGMKVSSKGFYMYSKVLNQNKMDRLEHLVDSKIKEAARKIEHADFRINPKQIGTKRMGCEFCTYHDLCFQTPKDIEYLKEYKKLEFLKEDAL